MQRCLLGKTKVSELQTGIAVLGGVQQVFRLWCARQNQNRIECLCLFHNQDTDIITATNSAKRRKKITFKFERNEKLNIYKVRKAKLKCCIFWTVWIVYILYPCNYNTNQCFISQF